MDAPIKFITRRAQIAELLRGEHIAGGGLRFGIRDGSGVGVVQHNLASGDVITKAMEPIERRAIKAFKLFNIFQKPRAMRIKLVANCLHLVLQLFITADHLRGFRTCLVEDPGEEAGLIRKP